MKSPPGEMGGLAVKLLGFVSTKRYPNAQRLLRHGNVVARHLNAVNSRPRELHVDRTGNKAMNAKRIGAVAGPLRMVDGVIVGIEDGGEQFHGPGHFGDEGEDGEVEPNGAVVDAVEDAVRGEALRPRIHGHRFGYE